MEIKRIAKRLFLVSLFLISTVNPSNSTSEEYVSLLIPIGFNHTFQCLNWNATITTKGDSPQNLIQATFKPDLGYERCFTYYNVYLHWLKPNHFKCNLSEGISIKRRTVQRNDQEYFCIFQREQKSFEVNFTDVKPGYYCILIKPCSGKCFETMLGSGIIKIEETQIDLLKENVVKETTSGETSDIPYISVVLVLTFIFGVIIYWNYKHRKVRKVPENIIENGEELPFLEPSATEVFILYYSDINTRTLVDDLANFLQEGAEFTVTVIDNRDPLFHIKPEKLLQNCLKCCTAINGKCICNKRIIIVVPDLSKLKKNEKENCTSASCSSDYGMELAWFDYVLAVIQIDWSRCLKDYTHLFVVYFGDDLYDVGEDDKTQMIAPGKRFSIQRQKLELCQELNYSFCEPSHKDKLIKYLNKHDIKNKLLSNVCK